MMTNKPTCCCDETGLDPKCTIHKGQPIISNEEESCKLCGTPLVTDPTKIKYDAKCDNHQHFKKVEPIKCWCRKCKQYKQETEMFAGLVHPDGIARGCCLECAKTMKDADFYGS